MSAPTDTPLDATAHYARRLGEARGLADALAARSSALSLMRVIAFASAVSFGLAGRYTQLGNPGYGLASASLLAFVVGMVIHDRVLEAKRRADASVEWAEEGLARLAGTFAHAPRPGELSAEDGHPYAHDLDVVGQGSILQSLDTTRLAASRALLSSWLLAPADADEVAHRQTCARDLAPRVALREALAVEGSIVADEPPDPKPLLQWAKEGSGLPTSLGLAIAAKLLPATTLGLLFFGGLLPVPRALWVVTLVMQLALSARHRAPLRTSIDAASEHHAALARYARMLAVVEAERFDAPPLEKLRVRLAEGPASEQIAKLGRIVGFVDARRNEVWKLFVGPLLSWDLNCALALERWRLHGGRDMTEHLDALVRIEALCALAARAWERPKDAWPSIPDEAGHEVVFHADGLAHPLIPSDKAVRNDVLLNGAGAVLLVTGSNMSGKSTLMRAIGANIVLALAGAPVRALHLRTSPFATWTSMRIRDDLAAGVSHFFAELRRLKAIVDAADAATNAKGAPVLFLLDEILHGTNSRERHLGAQAVVRRLAERNAVGAVSTHDLALAALEDELPNRVRNVHFREQVEKVDGVETMTFDYELRPGVVTSSNALRLMRIVGLDVPDSPTVT